MALSIVAIVILTSIVVYSADAAGIPKKAISTVSRFIESDLPTTTLFTDVQNTITSIQQFTTTSAVFENPAKTFGTTLAGGAVTANRTLNIPVITGTDTLGTLGLAQTWTNTNTYTGTIDLLNTGTEKIGSSKLLVRNPASSFAYTVAGSAITANRTLTLPLTTQSEIVAVQPQILSAAPANPAGTASTTGVMAGLGGTCKITPSVTGRVFVIITGQGQSNTGDDGFKVDLRFGTGVAPSNGGALTGTIIQNGITGSSVVSGASTGTPIMPFAVQGIVTGLTTGTQIWIDMGQYAVTGGTATFTNLECTAYEM